MACPLSGKELWDELKGVGWARTKASFHDLTKQLEQRELIRGEYVRTIVGRFSVRERHFEITIAGARAYHGARAFYSNGAEERVSR